MSISSRIHDTIEEWQAEWGDRLRDWLTKVLSYGIELVMEVIESKASLQLGPLLQKIENETTIPSELKPIWDELKTPTSAWAAVLAQTAGSSVIGGALMKVVDYILRPLSKGLSAAPGYDIPEPNFLTALWLRGKITNEELHSLCTWLGISDEHVEQLKELSQVRLDPSAVITAWRRDPVKYENLFSDLKDSGWDDSRIEALKFVTLYYPSPAELIHWQAREVFEPEMVSKYGLTTGLGELRREDFYKAGMDDAQIDNHWIAHWEHASFIQMREMLHRGIIEEQDVIDWFPLVEMAPFWGENLIKTMYTWPTRVDVRRFWDMRTISEERLRELYKGMGYHDENLEDYIKWTKVYTDFPMMIARFKNGWISPDDIRSWLRGLEIPEERITQFIEEKTKPEKPAQVEAERLATATEIMKGVKKEFITWAQGVEMLGELGYDAETAEFKLTVYGAVSTGSPESYLEFKEMTQRYRKSQGLPAKIPSPDLVQAEKDVTEAKKALVEVERQGLKNEKLAPYLKALSDTEYRFRQLITQWQSSDKP